MNRTDTETTASENTADTMAPKTKTVILGEPIQRGETTIREVTLRKPCVRDLKGVPLAKLMNVETDTLMQLITRTSTPTLLAHELDAMSVGDFFALTTEAMGFFVPPEATTTA